MIQKVKKPWGGFTDLLHEDNLHIKTIEVNGDGVLSLQSHKNRDEFWYVVEGAILVTMGYDIKNLRYDVVNEGSFKTIPKGWIHRMQAVGGKPARVVEIARGQFDEEDITRYEDAYGRATETPESIAV